MYLDVLLCRKIDKIKDNLFIDKSISGFQNQDATTDAFSDKWKQLKEDEDLKKVNIFQKDWFLKLYGLESEDILKKFLSDKKVILDAGCGVGYKAAWFAELNPNSLVIGMDFSESVYQAAELYKEIPNLIFIRGDIAHTCFKENSLDFINCDQVIHHTEDPQKTLNHFQSLIVSNGVINVYVYAKKAVPREMLDDHFRNLCKEVSKDDLWKLSEQLTELGKRLSELNLKFECPEIPLLNIKGGEIDIQRFIYWNFMKIFWNKELGYHNSVLTNYDWYSPANAYRYSQTEFEEMIKIAQLKSEFFRTEAACYTARLRKQ